MRTPLRWAVEVAFQAWLTADSLRTQLTGRGVAFVGDHQDTAQYRGGIPDVDVCRHGGGLAAPAEIIRSGTLTTIRVPG